jgi:hypothetical protein
MTLDKAICKSWKENTGMTLNPDRIIAHIEALSEWVNRKPRTIHYMNPTELANLYQDIISSLLLQGVLRKRAEELVATLAMRVENKLTAETTAFVDDLVVDQSALPYLGTNGDLVIPHNCPRKYHWWDGGQSITETRIEIVGP